MCCCVAINENQAMARDKECKHNSTKKEEEEEMMELGMIFIKAFSFMAIAAQKGKEM